jgi:hypothetical protein
VSKPRRRHLPDVAAARLRAEGDDAALAVAPVFGIGGRGVEAALEGVVDDWAAMDERADVIDEPSEEPRRY